MIQEDLFSPVVLIFPDIHKLWAFAQTLKCRKVQINLAQRLLLCDNCSEGEINIAQSYYGVLLSQGVESSIIE